MGEPVGSASTVIHRPGRLFLAGCAPAGPASVPPPGWIIGVSSAVVKAPDMRRGHNATAHAFPVALSLGSLWPLGSLWSLRLAVTGTLTGAVLGILLPGGCMTYAAM